MHTDNLASAKDLNHLIYLSKLIPLQVWAPVEQHRKTCKDLKYPCINNCDHPDVVVYNTWSTRFVRGVSEDRVLASPDLRCRHCYTRKKSIRQSIKNLNVDDLDFEARHRDLKSRMNSIIATYTAYHPKVVEYFGRQYRAIANCFGVYLTSRAALTEELVDTILVLSKGNDSSYISKNLSTLRALKRSRDEVSFCKCVYLCLYICLCVCACAAYFYFSCIIISL